MDKLRQLFDYQRFARNPRLQRQLDNVARRYLGQALKDDDLDVAAAGEPWRNPEPPGVGKKPW